MLNQLKMDLKIHGKSTFGKALVPLIGLAFGIFMGWLILWTGEETFFFCMGTLIAFLMLVLVSLIWGMHFPQEYMLALSMGRTRKEFLFSYALRSMLSQALGYLLVLLCYGIELTVYPLLYPGYRNEMPFDFLFYWWVIALAVPGVVLVQMFLGVLYSKFGKPFLAVAYFAWLGLCILGPQMIPDEDHTGVGAQMMGTVLQWARLVPSPIWMVIGIGAVIAMISTIVIEGKRLMVK